VSSEEEGIFREMMKESLDN